MTPNKHFVERLDWPEEVPFIPYDPIAVISDSHGHPICIERALSIIDSRHEDDQIVFAGDMINRGPDSFRCLDLVLDRIEKDPRTIALWGNHEMMVRGALANDPNMGHPLRMIWEKNGRETFLKEYFDPNLRVIMTDRLNRYFGLLKKQVTFGSLIVAHAGHQKDPSFWSPTAFYNFLKDKNPKHSLWPSPDLMRSPEWGIDTDNVLIHGHFQVFKGREYFLQNRKISADPGAPWNTVIIVFVRPSGIERHIFRYS